MDGRMTSCFSDLLKVFQSFWANKIVKKISDTWNSILYDLSGQGLHCFWKQFCLNKQNLQIPEIVKIYTNLSNIGIIPIKIK